ncbi:hypothetical protein K474DRAFT_1712852 [Panus rudis PR-1116 ss-1]|nr:hypothetical protein K474DRAFT_1712852 [Panus rudis PR-1116 ss-1]
MLAKARAAPMLCVVRTKIDMIPRDYSEEHLSYLADKHIFEYWQAVPYAAVSSITKEGMDDLLACIANEVQPPATQTVIDIKNLLGRIASNVLDVVASAFALPIRRLTSNVDSELEFLLSQPDYYARERGAWEEDVKRRLRIQPDAGVLTVGLASPSIVEKHPDKSERAAMEFAYDNTTIPVPRVFNSDDHFYMDFIKGESIYECWDGLSRLKQFRVACTLRLYVRQMRALRRDFVGAVDTRVVSGILFEEQRYKPFPSVRLFRRFCEYVAFQGWRRRVSAMQYAGEKPSPFPHPEIDWTPVFTHGDLNGSNIILDDHGTVWLIDWATGGFYPPCMEAQAMRHVEDHVRPYDIGDSWRSYRAFIVERTTAEEDQFWDDFFSYIHNCPGNAE